MKDQVKIVLIGMPGSGKSTLGKDIAKKLGFKIYDLDDLIVKREGTSIPKIFMEKGEGYFRRLETNVLSDLLDKEEAFVLSTGGGAPCYNENMDLINQKGVSVFLDVSLEQILERLTKGEVAKRPLFQGLETGEITLKLQDMLSERISYYEKAKIKLSGDDISTELLISELLIFFKS